MIKITYDVSGYITPKFFTFPDGTRHVKIEYSTYINPSIINVYAQISNTDDILDIALLKDAIDRTFAYVKKMALFIPYFPGSRQDRVMVNGEPLSVQVYANIINSLNFDRVTVLDPHSVATVAALKNGYSTNLEKMFYNKVDILKNSVVISPDAGAVKRAEIFAKTKGINKLIKADKTRDLATGKIIDFNLYADRSDIEGKNIYIVDDIVTNGGTFLGLLSVIRKYDPETVNLVVTHADHIEGLISMTDNFDWVYTTNSKGNYAEEHNQRPRLTVVDVFNGVFKE